MPSRVLVAELPLGERREHDHADAEAVGHGEQILLDPAVEHVVVRLVEDRPLEVALAADAERLGGHSAAVVADGGVDRLAALHRVIERAHRLVERRVGGRGGGG